MTTIVTCVLYKKHWSFHGINIEINGHEYDEYLLD